MTNPDRFLRVARDKFLGGDADRKLYIHGNGWCSLDELAALLRSKFGGPEGYVPLTTHTRVLSECDELQRKLEEMRTENQRLREAINQSLCRAAQLLKETEG